LETGLLKKSALCAHTARLPKKKGVIGGVLVLSGSERIKIPVSRSGSAASGFASVIEILEKSLLKG
jgi:hypothetical protein